MTILEHIGNTPLVRLERLAKGCANEVWAKCEHLNPGGSVKDRMALAIVNGAEQAGELQPGATLIEATAGNTGMGLALIAAVRGYKLVCVMPEKMSQDKRRSLRAMGAEVVVTDNAPLDDPRNFRAVAQRIARERGGYLTNQFANRHNPQVHETTTGPEIWQQTGGKVAAFVAGMGTGGSITGIGRFLKRQSPDVRIVLADPAGSRMADLVNHGRLGVDGSYLVEGIGSSAPTPILDLSVIDAAETVSDEESFAMAKRLATEEGLLVGASAGTAVVAALRLAARPNLDGPVVALLPDHWDRYQTTMLDEAWLKEKLSASKANPSEHAPSTEESS